MLNFATGGVGGQQREKMIVKVVYNEFIKMITFKVAMYGFKSVIFNYLTV